jgi:hypothetical protein
MSVGISVAVDHARPQPCVTVSRGADTITLSEPVTVKMFGAEALRSCYASVARADESIRGDAVLSLADGSAIRVVDVFNVASEESVSLRRRLEVIHAGAGRGLQVRLEAEARSPATGEAEWQYYLPCTLYNRNDSDCDGVEDYLGTYTQDLRDDRNGVLAALARTSRTGTAFSLGRVRVPTFDTLVTKEQLQARNFVQSTDIGSIGIAPRPDGSMTLRASYPFAEEASFCLDMEGSGWEAYAPLHGRLAIELDYELRIDSSTPDLTEAIWRLCERQRINLGTRRPTPDISLEDSLEYRQLLTQLNYRKWTKEENRKEPAGYLVHFSPRSGEVQGSLIEFGFSGDQTLVAWAQLDYGYRKKVPLFANRARSVIEFFIRYCQLRNGYSHGIYDPVHDQFTHWFTGIMMPFQYAADRADVRRFVGRHMAEALMPIADELRKVDGNYLRTMCESFYPILLAFELEASHGRTNDHWLAAGRRFGEFLVTAQSDDGSWFRAYATDGSGLISPAAWFGRSYAEQKSGTLFPIPVLTTLYTLTNDQRFLLAAEKAADFLIETYVEPTNYIGGLNDTTHIKSVKSDAVGVMFCMRSLLKIYETTDRPDYLKAAVKAAKLLCSWVYLWDVPMPEGTLLHETGFKSTGWAGCDVIASGSYLDNEFLEFTADLVRVAELSRQEALFDFAELVEYGMQYALSTPTNDHGYVAPGMQCEGVLTSYWISAPDTTTFSGAVNKLKGDDNDTCNALTNAQMAYGIYTLTNLYGTCNFDQIREEIFGRRSETPRSGDQKPT